MTNYKDLCLGVIGDIYNNELADKSDRDKIVVSLPFVRSIVPYVKNLEGCVFVMCGISERALTTICLGRKGIKARKRSILTRRHTAQGKVRKDLLLSL